MACRLRTASPGGLFSASIKKVAACVWVVSDLIDEIDEKMTVVNVGYRAARKQLKDYRDGADETTT